MYYFRVLRLFGVEILFFKGIFVRCIKDVVCWVWEGVI